MRENSKFLPAGQTGKIQSAGWRTKFHSGFTLAETVVSFLIVLLLIGGALELLRDSLKSNDSLSSSLDSQSEIRNAFRSMSAEIRSASPSSLGAYPIDTAATSSFIFYSDIDGDGLKERVRYFLSAGILKKGVIKPAGNPLVYNPAAESLSPLIKNIIATSSVFYYYGGDYDGNSAPLPAPTSISDVRLIKIIVLTGKNMEFTTQISIRNLKDNL